MRKSHQFSAVNEFDRLKKEGREVKLCDRLESYHEPSNDLNVD